MALPLLVCVWTSDGAVALCARRMPSLCPERPLMGEIVQNTTPEMIIPLMDRGMMSRVICRPSGRQKSIRPSLCKALKSPQKIDTSFCSDLWLPIKISRRKRTFLFYLRWGQTSVVAGQSRWSAFSLSEKHLPCTSTKSAKTMCQSFHSLQDNECYWENVLVFCDFIVANVCLTQQ